MVLAPLVTREGPGFPQFASSRLRYRKVLVVYSQVRYDLAISMAVPAHQILRRSLTFR
jgi:hypothetical protein